MAVALFKTKHMLCARALWKLLDCVIAVGEEANPAKLGLSRGEGSTYVQGVHASIPNTECRTSALRCYRIKRGLDR